MLLHHAGKVSPVRLERVKGSQSFKQELGEVESQAVQQCMRAEHMQQPHVQFLLSPGKTVGRFDTAACTGSSYMHAVHAVGGSGARFRELPVTQAVAGHCQQQFRQI